MLRRSPLKRTGGLRSGTQLASKGITRKPSRRLTASRQQFYDVKPQVYTRDRGLCVCCGARMTDYHHRQPRGMGGSSRSTTIHSPAALICVCRACHNRLESERSWAEKSGYIVRRGITNPAEVLLVHHGAWALLSDDGSLLYVTQPEEQETA